MLYRPDFKCILISSLSKPSGFQAPCCKLGHDLRYQATNNVTNNAMNKALSLVYVGLFLFFMFYTSLLQAQSCNSKVPLSTPNSDFELKKSGTEVHHKTTKLIWQRCVLGMYWNGKTCTGTPKKYSYQGALDQAEGAWRVPTIKELATLVEYACVKPSINTTFFPNTPYEDRYWSSSPDVDDDSSAWELNFEFGNAYFSYRTTDFHVRLVRSGQ